MKKLFLSLVYTLILAGFLFLVYFVAGAKIDHYLYSYKPATYNYEIDSLFQSQFIKRINVKYIYKSGERGSIYFIQYDSLSKILVIETNNYPNVKINDVQILSGEKMDITQNKTYTTIFKPSFPVIEQMLNPKRSKFLTITIKKPFQIENRIKNKDYCYIKGNLGLIAFGDTQEISIVSFLKKYNNEILVVKSNDKMFFILLSSMNPDTRNESLLKIIKVPGIPV